MPIPQTNRTGVSTSLDVCLTPPEATQLIIPFLKQSGIKTVWECAVGVEQTLIADILRREGFEVVCTDKRSGFDFLTDTPDFHFDAIVTNPPFSLDYKFLERVRYYNIPSALLLKNDRDGVARCAKWLFDSNGYPLFEKIVPQSRIAYCMPQKGWESSPQFSTAWWTFGFNIGITVLSVPYVQEKRTNGQMELF